MRKAAYLARQATVTMVDRRPAEVPEGVVLIVGEAADNLGLIDGTNIVVAATGDAEIDEMVCARANERGKLFNRADGPGNFLIPSIIERRNFMVAISTLGRSPGMSRHIRESLDASLLPAMEDMVDLTCRLRERLKDVVPEAREREGRVRRIIGDQEIWEARKEDPAMAYELAEGKVLE